MTTHEIEEMLGITKQSLIYYEKEGLITPRRNENNYRDYEQKDIDIFQKHDKNIIDIQKKNFII